MNEVAETKTKGADVTIRCTAKMWCWLDFSLSYHRLDDRRTIILQGPLPRNHWFAVSARKEFYKPATIHTLHFELEVGTNGNTESEDADEHQ